MSVRVDGRYLLGLGAIFLWGCPIDDAKFKEPAGTSSSSSSSSSSGSESSSSSSSSSSGNGASAGNGGAAGMGGTGGMGGAVASSSSSGGGMGGVAGMGGMGGMGGSGGSGPVCPEVGAVGSCGTPNCPACPKLVMVGTGMTDGTAATFASDKGWSTATIAGIKSDYPPAFAIRNGKNDGVAVFRNTTVGFLYHLGYAAWTESNGFGMVNDVDGGNALVDTSPVAVASADAVHVAFLEVGNGDKYRYAQFRNALWTPKNEIIQNGGTSLGSCAPALTAVGSNVVLLNPGWMNTDESLYSRTRDGAPAGVWDPGYKYSGITQLVDDVTPAIVPLGGGPTMLIVFTEKVNGKPLYWLTGSGNTWSNPVLIPLSSSIETALLPLPGGGAILVYRDFVTNTISWSRFDGTTWSTVQTIPGGMTTKSKPILAFGAGDAVAELLFVDTAGNARHARLHKGATNFTTPTMIPGATGLVGMAAATNL